MLKVAILVALAQFAPSAPGPPVPPGGLTECTALLVTSPQQPPPALSTAFSARRILDLRFGTFVRRPADGSHLVELKVYTPRGHLYQTLSVPFASAGTPRGLRTVEGEARPLPKQVATGTSLPGTRPYEVGATLPVGGTAITSNSLYGKWRVEPYLDGAVCGPSATFEIRP